MRYLTNIGRCKIDDMRSLTDLTEDIMGRGAKPLCSFAELLIDEVIDYHVDEEDRPIESGKLLCLAYEIRDRAEELEKALDLCFTSAFNLIPDPTDKKEVCNELSCPRGKE